MANGGLKALGYIEPPFPITDFVPVYYGTEEEPYAAEIADHRIIDLYRVSAAAKKIPFPMPYAKKIGDPAYYCYLSPGGEVICGTFTEIANRLYGWLTARELDNFGKLSLAYFFQLHGYQKRLIRQIMDEYRKNDSDFQLLEVEGSPVRVEGNGTEQVIMTINEVLRHWDSLLDTYKLSWLDPLFVDGGGIYFSKYYFTVQFFVERIAQGKSILRDYLAFLSLEDRYSLLKVNPQLYRSFLNIPIPSPLSSTDEAAIMDTLTVAGDVDNDLSRRTGIPDSATSVAAPDVFVQKLKDLKGKLKTRAVGKRFLESDFQA